MPGGANLPMYDALAHYPQIHHVLVRHEQAAAHMAVVVPKPNVRIYDRVCLWSDKCGSPG